MLPMDNDIIRASRNSRLAGILVAALTVIFLFGAGDAFAANLVIATAVAYLCPPLPFRQWSAIDYAVMGGIAYDAVSGFYGASRVLLVDNLAMCAITGSTYMSLRRLCDDRKATGSLLGIIGVAAIIALLLALFTFHEIRKSSVDEGFDGADYTRFLYRPVGYLVNVWGEVTLVFMGVFCIARRKAAFVPLLLSTVAIMLTFSKGAYLSLVIFVMGSLLLACKRVKRHITVACILAAAITVIFCYGEFSDMLSLGGRSQQMSAQWRVETTASAADVVAESPVWGHGNGSYTLATDKVSSQDSSKNYTSFAPNLWIQLLVEKGIVGLVLLLAAAVTVAAGIWRRRHDKSARIIGVLLLAMLAKECTQSVLMETPVLQLMTIILLALLQRNSEKTGVSEIGNTASRRQRIVPAVVLLSMAVLIAGHSRAFNTRQEAVREGRYDDIAASGKPGMIQKGVLLAKRYAETHDPADALAAEELLAGALATDGNDDFYPQYLLARLKAQQGDIETGREILAGLTKRYSHNSLLLYALGDIDYRQGNIDAARTCWRDALYYTPRVLHIENVAALAATDSTFRRQLTSLKSKLHTPQDKARYGYILYHLGCKAQAKAYLMSAVGELPNLATPWLLLGDTGKYRFLTNGIGYNPVNDDDAAAAAMVAECDEWALFDAAYRVRFKNWYGFDLYGRE